MVNRNTGNTYITTTTTNEVIAPAQPAFLATTSGVISNITGDTTSYTIVFATEIFDQNSDFDGTSTFTAPVTGLYNFMLCTYAKEIAANHTYGEIFINASNRLIRCMILSPATARNAGNTLTLNGENLIDMDAGDTCTCGILYDKGSKVVDLDWSADPVYNCFSGALIC